MSNENPTFAEMIALLDGPVSNTAFRLNDQRRAVLLQALRIAEESGQAMQKLRPKQPPFDISKLTFGERYVLGQLRDGPMELWGEHVTQPARVLKNRGLITIEELAGDRAGNLHPGYDAQR